MQLQYTTGTGPDTTAPTVLSVSPPNGRSNVGDNAYVRVVFSKPVNPLTVNANTLQLLANGTDFVPDSITFSNSNQNVLIVPHAPLPDSTVMNITISGVRLLGERSSGANHNLHDGHRSRYNTTDLGREQSIPRRRGRPHERSS